MKRILAALLVFLFLNTYVSITYAEDFGIDAPSYILIDPKTSQVLAEKNADEKMYPASTTKIMTAIIALEKGDLNQLMTASRKAIDPGYGGMHIGINEGEQILLEDLLNAMLIKSANDTANIIAENLGSSYEEFIEQMNKKAAELGALNTHFVNPHGMHDTEHYTTVRDMSKIARYAMSMDKFREIVKKSAYDMRITNKHDKWDRIYTINRLLKNLPEYKSEYFTAIGVKSGYTSQAGNNLVSAAVNNNGMELLAVVFGVKSAHTSSDVYSCSKKLLEYGFKNYSIQTVVSANHPVKSIQVADAAAASTLDLVTASDLSVILPANQDMSQLQENIVLSSSTVNAPVAKGDVLGYIEFKKLDVVLGKVNIIASQSIVKNIKAETASAVKSAMVNTPFKKVLTGLIIVLIVFFFLRVSLRTISKIMRSKNKGFLK